MIEGMKFVRVPSADPDTATWWSEDGRVVLRRFRRHNVTVTVDGAPIEGSWASSGDAKRAAADYLHAEDRRRTLVRAAGLTVASIEHETLEDDHDRITFRFADGSALMLLSSGDQVMDGWGQDFYEAGSSIEVAFEEPPDA